MKAMIVLAVLLILLGIAIISYQWATYTASSGVFQSAGTQER